MERKCGVIRTDEKGMKRMNRGETNPWLTFGKDFAGVDRWICRVCPWKLVLNLRCLVLRCLDNCRVRRRRLHNSYKRTVRPGMPNTRCMSVGCMRCKLTARKRWERCRMSQAGRRWSRRVQGQVRARARARVRAQPRRVPKRRTHTTVTIIFNYDLRFMYTANGNGYWPSLSRATNNKCPNATYFFFCSIWRLRETLRLTL